MSKRRGAGQADAPLLPRPSAPGASPIASAGFRERGLGGAGLTFRGRMGTLSLSEFMPGMMTVMRRGPRKPSTLVSWEGGAP